jgi:hypothetical protein
MPSEDRLRTRIAVEAARIMAEEAIEDHGLAKKKAAARLGVATQRNLPRREEIEAALIEHHRLFGQTGQPERLAAPRRLALEAMQFLAAYSPLLVGGVWSGCAGKFSPIRLYLYPPAPEDVIRKLLDAHIPYEEKSHRVARDAETLPDQPALHFYVDGVRVELLLLPPSWKGQTLRNKGGLLAGGGIKELQRLIGLESQPDSPSFP